jgi:hypothetical protein
MFKATKNANPYHQQVYEENPYLQKIYNTFEEITNQFPHIQKPYDRHTIRLGLGFDVVETVFSVELIEINCNGFIFTAFVFVPLY